MGLLSAGHRYEQTVHLCCWMCVCEQYALDSNRSVCLIQSAGNEILCLSKCMYICELCKQNTLNIHHGYQKGLQIVFCI